MSTPWEAFERTVLADDYVGYRTDVIKAAAAWVQDEVKKAELAVLEEAGQIALDFAPAAMELGVVHRINALRDRILNLPEEE